MTELQVIRSAIEKAERRLITARVVANAERALDRLATRKKLQIAKNCWRVIHAFLMSRNVQMMSVPVDRLSPQDLAAAWTAFHVLEEHSK